MLIENEVYSCTRKANVIYKNADLAPFETKCRMVIPGIWFRRKLFEERGKASCTIPCHCTGLSNKTVSAFHLWCLRFWVSVSYINILSLKTSYWESALPDIHSTESSKGELRVFKENDFYLL